MDDFSLPVGFRFLPTDEEIINYFLPLKLNGKMISNDPILNFDLYGEKEPWKLFSKNLKQSFYVFTKLKKRSNNGSMIKRTAGVGTWDGQNTDIVKDHQGRSIGSKKLLVFQVPKAFNHQAKGNGHWIMHEFSIHPKDGYVICRIRNKDLDKENQRTTTRIFQLQELDAFNYENLHARKCSPSAEEETHQQLPKRLRGSDQIEQDSVIQSKETEQNCSNSVVEYNPETNTIKESTGEVMRSIFDELDDINNAADDWDSILNAINFYDDLNNGSLKDYQSQP